MEWYQGISYSITNGIRIFVCLFCLTAILKTERPAKSMVWLSLIFGVIAAALNVTALPKIFVIALEAAMIVGLLHLQCGCEIRISLFLTFFFEVAAALWDFLFSTGLGILLHSCTLSDAVQRYMIGIWITRLLMICMTVMMQSDRIEKVFHRGAAIIAVVGLFGVILLTEQSVVPVPDEQAITWVILSLILMMAVLFYRLNQQKEMEQEIIKLKEEQVELLERDYHALNQIYTANAKLFHDFHNHIEVLHRYLTQGETNDAIHYLEDLRTPMEEITQTVWIGDEAVDYLISSKLALAEQKHIHTEVNIEFPRHTNIRSVDLTAVLGNLLDNALEAAETVEGGPRFINLVIRRINNMLIIKVENSFDAEPVMDNGDLQTSKADKSLHGWGLKNVWTAAERYEGTIETSYGDHIFTAVVTMFYNAV